MSGIFNLAQMLMGRPDPQQQLLASLGGGGPQPPAGRPAAASATAAPPAAGGAQGAPEPQATKSTADLAAQNQQLMDPGAIMRAMMQMQQRNRAEDMFTQGLGGLMSALSRSPSAAYHNQLLHQFDPQGQIDPASMMQNYAAIQNFNMQQRQLQAFYNSLPEASQATGLSINELMGMGPEGLRQILLSQAGVGGPAEYQEFTRARNEWARQNGLKLQNGVYKDADGNTVPVPDKYSDFETWKTTLGEQAKQKVTAGEEKQNAIDTYPSMAPTYKTAEDKIDWLLANKPAVIEAVHWGSLAGGRAGQYNPALSQKAADARAILDQLGDINFRAGLSNVKNVRSQSEAMKVGGSVTSLDKVQNSDQAISDELDRLGTIIHSAHGNLMAAAGKTNIPMKYSGLIDDSLLNPKSSIYNGATMEKGRTPTDAELAEFKRRVDAGEDPAVMRKNARDNGVEMP